jgi:hypothetical protein
MYCCYCYEINLCIVARYEINLRIVARYETNLFIVVLIMKLINLLLRLLWNEFIYFCAYYEIN